VGFAWFVLSAKDFLSAIQESMKNLSFLIRMECIINRPERDPYSNKKQGNFGYVTLKNACFRNL
jgi:hypothetical protein